jgi:ketopantoate reductase
VVATAVAELLERASLGECIVVSNEDTEEILYRKLMTNSIINPITALLGSPNKIILDENLEALIQSLAMECAAVAAAKAMLFLSPLSKLTTNTRVVGHGSHRQCCRHRRRCDACGSQLGGQHV